MKIVLLFIFLIGFFPALHSQEIVKKGTAQDTLVKTRTFRETKENTPQGVAIRFKDVTPPRSYWKLQAAYGMAFGDQTTFNFVPQVSYSQNVYFTLGGGLNYIYYYLSHKGEKEKMHYAGINLFARLTPLPYLVFQVQPELLERWGKQNGRQVSGRLVPTFLAGGGFDIPLGPGNVNILFLFDIIQNDYTPYGKNLYYTIGYSFFL